MKGNEGGISRGSSWFLWVNEVKSEFAESFGNADEFLDLGFLWQKDDRLYE